jgi:hypothetical protein
MSKQTAVEWLIKELTPSITLQQKYIDELETKAKEMEKQNAVQFAIDWWGDDSDLSAKEYYNQTFKN